MALEAPAESNHVQEPDHIQVIIKVISENTRHDIEGEILCLESLHQHHEQGMLLENDPLCAFKTTSNPGTMYIEYAQTNV